jgi:hypothetical protein
MFGLYNLCIWKSVGKYTRSNQYYI